MWRELDGGSCVPHLFPFLVESRGFEGSLWVGSNQPAVWASGDPVFQQAMLYFFLSLPKARRSLPASRAARVTLPLCFASNDST